VRHRVISMVRVLCCGVAVSHRYCLCTVLWDGNISCVGFVY